MLRLRTIAAGMLIASVGFVYSSSALAATSRDRHVAREASTIYITGAVECQQDNVVGVYIEAGGGGSGFADWQRMPGNPYGATYQAKIQNTTLPENVRLHVGCGGSPSAYYSDNWTGNAYVTGSSRLNAGCAESPVRGNNTRCFFISTGASSSTNNFGRPNDPGAAGYCTCGAAYLWKLNTGSYPGFNGNASAWATNARAARWTVTRTPLPGSILVMPSGDHVAWVRGVYVDADGVMHVRTIEMNGGTMVDPQRLITTEFGKLVAHDRKYYSTSDWQFIEPPPITNLVGTTTVPPECQP